MFARFFLATALLSTGLSPLHAQGDDYQRLVDAIAAEERLVEGFEEGAREESLALYANDPDMVKMEQVCPGLSTQMVDAMLPILLQSHKRAVGEYRGALLALFRERLPVDVASPAGVFFSSDLGQKLIGLVEEHAVVDALREDAYTSEDASVSQEAYDADKAKTREAVKANLEPVLLREIGMALSNAEWFPKFHALKPEMDALEFALIDDDFTPEEDAALDGAIETVMDAQPDDCFGEEE